MNKVDQIVKTTSVSSQHKKFHSEIIIQAPKELVWNVLCEFDSYKNWTHFFLGITGNFNDQEMIEAHFQLNPKKPKVTTFKNLINLNPGESFSWQSTISVGMKDHHQFKVESIDSNTTRFIHSDEVKGGLTFLFGFIPFNIIAKHYPIFNLALKKEVERRFKLNQEKSYQG